jgi:hypothetical protein
VNSLHQASGKPKAGRMPLNIHSLESIVLNIAKHGRGKLRERIAFLAQEVFVADVIQYARGLGPRRGRGVSPQSGE